MAQFDVYKNPQGGTYPLLLDVQADVLVQLPSRIVVPMVPRRKYSARPVSRLHPLVTIAGTEHILLVHEMAAVPASVLGSAVHSLAARRAELIAAIDLLFTGI